MTDPRLADDLIATLTAARAAERDVLGGLPPEVRSAPGTDGGWSPKDVQAHLTAWKARQAGRLAAARRDEVIAPTASSEIDRINAEQHAARADWPWADVEAEADWVTEELAGELRGIDVELLVSSEPLLGGAMGNGASHTLEHLARLGAEHDMQPRVLAFAAELEAIIRDSPMPASEKGVFLYNQACFHSLGGRLDAARGLLPDAFGLRPDLIEFAPRDADLAALRGELQALARR